MVVNQKSLNYPSLQYNYSYEYQELDVCVFYDLQIMVKVNTAKSLEEALAVINDEKDTTLDVHR